MQSNDIGKVKAYWEERVTDWKIAKHQPGSEEFFREIDEYRFEKLHYIPEIINFPDYEGLSVLEVGCGLGNDLSHFAINKASVTGIDLAERAVDLASTNFNQRNIPGTFLQMNGEKLEFEDNSFDVVYCHTVIQFTPLPEKMISEIYRVLKKDGTAIIMGINSRSWLIMLHKLMKVEIDYLDAPFFHKFSIGQFKRMLNKFDDVGIISERYPVRTKVHKGIKAIIFNLIFVDLFNIMPKFAVKHFGHHLIAFAKK